MATWNPFQTGFMKRLAIVVAAALAGWVLIAIADSLILDTGTGLEPGCLFLAEQERRAAVAALQP